MKTASAVLITGASSGIGAIYANRFAKRGHNLVLVARDLDRLESLAKRLRQDAGVTIDVIQADLTNLSDLLRVERRLREDTCIEILVNNAGINFDGGFAEHSVDQTAHLININTVAPARLASAITPRFVEQGKGSIINIASVVGLMPEYKSTTYGATKAFLLFFSQGLHAELGPKGIYVQAVLPSATRTEIWERSGRDINTVPVIMEAEELVDAALEGFDRRETVTIPSLPDENQWHTFESSRQIMAPNFRQLHAASRYLKAQ